MGKYIQSLCRLKDISNEPEEQLNEDKKEFTLLKCEVVKVIKDMRSKNSTGEENIPAYLLKERGSSGWK